MEGVARADAAHGDAQALVRVSMHLERLEQHFEDRFDKLEAQVAALQQLLEEQAGMAGGSNGGGGSPGAADGRGVRRPGGDVDGESARLRPRLESPILEQPPELHTVHRLQQLLETQPEGSTPARAAA
jgi:hypothetical protein